MKNINDFIHSNMSSDALLELSQEFKRMSEKLNELALDRKKTEDFEKNIKNYIKTSHILAIKHYFGCLKRIPKGYSEGQLRSIAHSLPVSNKIRKIEQQKLGLSIIKLFRKGLNRKEVAQKLDVSISTVDKHYKKTYFY